MVTHLLAMSLFGISTFNPFSDPAPQTHVLAKHEFSLDDRYKNREVNAVFKENILLTLAYMDGTADNKTISWDKVTKPFSYTFTLDPKQTFAFHNDVLPEYKGSVVQTTNAHFTSDEGFKSDGYLVGDGVCHFASLIDWTARDAGLMVNAPTTHDFAAIPDIPKEYGVAIYDQQNNSSSSEQQNLYITNNQAKPVSFTFDYHNNTLAVAVSENQ